ncbi:MAG TPA: 50S ribosomal protein L21, partial [Phycisphaerales bacterium]|nr:50S ribosomal protein L21 [Phycisphaerales bacterium]
GDDKGSKVGTPYVSGAKVTADIVEREFKGEKIDIFRYARRKGFSKRQGHRQRHMKVKVTAING